MMDVSRSCKISKINWGALPELEARLRREDISVNSCSVTLRRFPDQITYSSFDEAAKDVLNNDPPKYYDLHIFGSTSGHKSFSCSVICLKNIHGDDSINLSVKGIDTIDTVDSIMSFIGLEPDEYTYFSDEPSKTAFIAHRFDKSGIECSEKLARFLELIGFEVLTGRAYSPQSVSSKVRERIEKQSVVFAIVTSGEDNTWLTQESILSEVKGKPLIVLKENSVNFKTGLLADHEFIPFDPPRIESGFISILEGLREIGYYY